ncbi:unnamed protein product [Ectocarpus fasciculatus]
MTKTAKDKKGAASNKSKFKADDKVYAMDSGDLYEAKVIKLKPSGEQFTYFLHYMGWNSRWDKWVVESDLMAAGPEALEMQQQLKDKKKKAKVNAAKRKEDQKVKEQIKKEDQKIKRARVDVKKDTEDDSGVTEVKVAMPFTLKKQLVTDWEHVTQEPRRLVKLPRELTAANVMAQYMESKANRGTPQQTARAQELMDGVRIYFDKALPLILLYRQERTQYDITVQKLPGKSPSEIYGAEHLLRVFVRLPQLLAQSALTPPEVTQVQKLLADFLRFMQKNHASFFVQEYEDEEPEEPQSA